MSALEGIRVVELGLWVAGPAAGGLLADLGADVVKIEPPAGDPMRRFFSLATGSKVERNPPFELDNRGKRSVVIDLTDSRGRDATERIITGADVFLTNMRPRALEKLGLDHESLLARHPELIYTSITGYGLRGEERDRPGYDVGAFWARTGVADTLRAGDGAPPAIRGGFGDHITAITTIAAILAAIVERTHTGKGRLVETSLQRTGMYCIGWDLGIQLEFDKVKRPVERAENEQPILNCYRAADDRWFWLIGLEADRHFPGVLQAIERPELAADERFATVRDQRRNRAALIAILDAAFASRPLEHWAERFDAEGVWWAPVQTPAESVADRQALANDAVVSVPGMEGGTTRQIAPPFGLGDACTPRGAAPKLGQHTREVLLESGLSEADVEKLAQLGVLFPRNGGA